MPLLLEHRVAADVVVEVRVAAVDDRVARLEVLEQLRDLGLGRVAGRDHDPDGPRRLELADELLDREGRRRSVALGLDLRRLLRRPVVDHDLVPVADQPADHVGAHPTETDEADPHVRSSLRQVVASAASSARSRAARPASGSAPRWTRRIGRSWPRSAAKSPSAWASMSRPNVYGQPGIGRSAGWSAVSWRNQPIGGPPLWSWPVEWRKRGP